LASVKETALTPYTKELVDKLGEAPTGDNAYMTMQELALVGSNPFSPENDYNECYE